MFEEGFDVLTWEVVCWRRDSMSLPGRGGVDLDGGVLGVGLGRRGIRSRRDSISDSLSLPGGRVEIVWKTQVQNV